MSNKLGKYIAAFDYIDKTLIALSAASGGVSIISFKSVNKCRNSKCKSYFKIFFNCRDNKEIVKSNKAKKKKHNKIVLLAKSKLNSIETLMSQALIDWT